MYTAVDIQSSKSIAVTDYTEALRCQVDASTKIEVTKKWTTTANQFSQIFISKAT